MTLYYFYKLCSLDIDITDIYVGSTKNFRQRKSDHKIACNNINNAKYHRKVYSFIRENGGWDNWNMVEVGRRECIDIKDAHRVEDEYMRNLGATLNNNLAVPKCIHNRKKATCKECGGVSICEHNNYKSTCKECGGVSICEHDRIRSKCKECHGGSVCMHNKQRAQCKECDGSRTRQVQCECGSIVQRKAMYKHITSKKHIKYVEQ